MAILLREFGVDYVHAQLYEAALHAFAAENQARMEAMVRQEGITAEIIELVAGETASCSGFGR